jgi:rhamnosyl/mannosyltransferase
VKILQVNKLYHPWHGGIEHVVQDIAEGLQAKGWTVDVLTCVPKGPGREDQVNGVRVIRASSLGIYLSMPLSLDLITTFRRLHRSYNVILLHHPFPLGFVAQWVTAPAAPTVVWYHADIVRQQLTGAAFRPILNDVLDRSARVLASSAQLCDSSPILRRIRDRCTVVPFGIQSDKYAATPAIQEEAVELRRRFGTPLLLAIGRLVPYKGYGILLEAMERVPASLLIVGDGPLRDALAAAAKRRRLSRVFFAGVVPSTLPYLHACDALVLPSVSAAETFGIVQVEAMACGKPVVNTSVPSGVTSVSVDQVTGLTVPPGDPNALGSALTHLLEDDALRVRMGDAGRRRVGQLFTMDAFVSAVQSVLEQVGRTPGS